MTKLAADPLVESLLLLHDLHPLPMRTGSAGRSTRSCPSSVRTRTGGVRPASTRPAWSGIRLELSAHGHQAHAGAVQEAIEQAVADAAPDAAGVSFDVVDGGSRAAAAADGRSPAARGAR